MTLGAVADEGQSVVLEVLLQVELSVPRFLSSGNWNLCDSPRASPEASRHALQFGGAPVSQLLAKWWI